MKDQWYVDACMTWNEVLERKARRYPQKPLLVMQNRTLTFGQFYEQVTTFAKGLLQLGVRKHDVVGIWMPNSLEWVIAQFAIYKTGAMLLPLYSYYRRTELEYALQQAGVDVLIMADRFLGKIDAFAIFAELVPEVRTQPKEALFCSAFPSLRSVVAVGDGEDVPGRYRYDEVHALGRHYGSDRELLRREAAVSPFDVMNIMYTSGTTGFPKGGMSMHITNLTTITLWSELARLTPDDVILCHVPLFTNFGGLYGAALGVRNACKVVITEQFDAAESLRLIEQQRVTYIPGTPSMFRMLLDHPDLKQRDLSSVRGGHVAGAPLTDTTMHEIIEVLGAREIMQAWGLSECGGLSTVSTSEHPYDKRLKSVGKPLRSADVRVVDSQTLAPVAPGEPGEIVLGDVHPGSCVGKGYFRMPEKTRAAITEDGWFRTGDVGFFDEEGYLHISGRVDDMFTVGGFNVYPAEIENKLEQLEGVREGFIVPLPDRRLGSVPVAWIARDEGAAITAEEIIAYCKDRMAAQKVPRRVFFYTPGELPMTPAGKVKKKELAERTAATVRSDRATEPIDSAAAMLHHFHHKS